MRILPGSLAFSAHPGAQASEISEPEWCESFELRRGYVPHDMPIGMPVLRGSSGRAGKCFQLAPVEGEYVRQPNRLGRQVEERAANNFAPPDPREKTEGRVSKQGRRKHAHSGRWGARLPGRLPIRECLLVTNVLEGQVQLWLGVHDVTRFPRVPTRLE